MTVFVLGLLLACLLGLHHLIPTTRGLALIVESALPWTWVLLALLVLFMLIRFSVWSIIGVIIPALLWAGMFGAYLKPQPEQTASDIVVASQNVGARLPQPTATAKNIIDQAPDIVTIQEIESLSGEIIQKEMNAAYDYSAINDTIGVWSKWPVGETELIDLGLEWPRAFATTISTDHGDIRFYAVHMPSVRPGQESLRNAALQTLAEKIKDDPAEHVVVAGDFNSTSSDRYFSELEGLDDTRKSVGGGFGFTWPSAFPVVRLDHILVRGFDPQFEKVMDRGTSDHRAIVAGMNLS